MITKSSRDLAENVCLTCKLSGAETRGLLCPALRTWIMKVLGRSFFWVLFPVLPWAVQAVEHEEVAQRVIKLHRGRGVAAMQSRQWVRDSCRKLSGLLRQKNAVLNKLKTAIGAVEKDVGLSDEEKLFQVHTFEIFQKELNESENSVFQAVYGLQRALQGDYKDVVNMKESSRQRLEALREAAIKEETEYMELLAAEKHQVEALKNMQHQNQSLSMLDEILEDVRKAADRLEEEIEEHAFDDNKSDIVTIGMLSLPCGWLCTAIGLPTMFGYIICGVLLGPSGLNSIKSIVQVETLGEFGVFFTLFLVGLEFSPEKLRKHCRGSSPNPGFDWSDSFFTSGGFSFMSCYKEVSHWTLLSEAAHGKQGEQRNPDLGNICLYLLNVNGHGAAGRLHGAGLFPGWSARLLSGPRGHRGDRHLHRTHPRLPGHRFLRLHRAPRVPHVCGVRAHGAGVPHLVSGGDEVSPGGAGPVSHSAEEQPVHQVDRLCGACPGQRVFLCPGEPGAKSGRHLSGGVPPYTECDHAQPLARPGAVESCNHEVCAQTGETVQPLMARR
ncbi:transmembrane and coiled-coil domain-containing protein 3 isoform X11 [Homo sapiens]|uniref:transmembrane and coiled-coil domain-containing protein 3 isoform X11 n=2 Tax=Homo sapiens TaxID=9606 RepID=UPI001FB0D9D5|nr:transmembrane and coiled-coil domain-containing protein 3 isoform X11 [Homo sapiens]XP_054230602.1 transmembrane and coiled-coil domain-containing protein 3 isoform X11 [Homo sapiens]